MKWAIFDLGIHPPPAYAKGRVCILGDAAHATSPHHGSGASLAIEDAAVLSEMLVDEKVKSYEDVEKAFAVFDEVRRPRGEILVQSSRHMGQVLDYQIAEITNIAEIAGEYTWRQKKLQDVDVAEMCKEAKAKLRERLA